MRNKSQGDPGNTPAMNTGAVLKFHRAGTETKNAREHHLVLVLGTTSRDCCADLRQRG